MGNRPSEFSIVCPSCDSTIEVNDILRDQIRHQVESDFESRLKTERQEIAELRKTIQTDQQKLEKSQENLNNLVAKEVQARELEIESKATDKAKIAFEVRLTDRQNQIDEMTKQVNEFQENQLSLLQQKRNLENEKAELKLQVARELDSERNKLMEKAKDQFKLEFDLKYAEKDKTIEDMRKTIGDLKRKSEQVSQQLQGEVQELALETLLESAFRTDMIEPVKKGVRGADALQHVINSRGQDCGSILWESKRTKAWQKAWLEKLRDDQRNSKAACAVLVSEVLPPGITTFGFVEGVWVCSWPCIVGLTTALRLGMIEMASATVAADGKTEKMELVYQYLAGSEFQHRIGAIVEAFVSMQADLESEKRSMQRSWAKRSKQLERAINSASGLYGDLQGIVGSTLPALPELSLPKLTNQKNGESDSKHQME